MDYVFSNRAKKTTLITAAIGLVLLIVGAFIASGQEYPGLVEDGHNYGFMQRLWSNVLVNGFFFFSISLAMLFFMILQYASEASWSIVFKRVFEAVIAPLPLGIGLIILVLIVGHFHGHHIYHWMSYDMSWEPDHEKFDHLLHHKGLFFQPYFFWPVLLFFMGAFLYFANNFRKRSLLEDQEGGTKIHFKNITKAAIFLLIFGYGSSVLAWQIIMSIDTHWFSTLFGWYVFAGMWLTGMTFTTLLILYLKGQGLLQIAKKGHLHDMGKWMFALSFLWTYLFFSQFMLIWYADVPEETTYYIARINDYKGIWFTMLLVNFALPMLALMDAEAKKNKIILVIVGVVIFLFHWVDVFTMVSPGSMKDQATIGLMEIGMFLMFLGVFVFMVLKSLASRPLVVKNHPYIEESKHIHG
jgi:hypothetical protein